jgi:hypothetical protein
MRLLPRMPFIPPPMATIALRLRITAILPRMATNFLRLRMAATQSIHLRKATRSLRLIVATTQSIHRRTITRRLHLRVAATRSIHPGRRSPPPRVVPSHPPLLPHSPQSGLETQTVPAISSPPDITRRGHWRKVAQARLDARPRLRTRRRYLHSAPSRPRWLARS